MEHNPTDSLEVLLAAGQRDYADVIDRLAADGFPASFTQTGGRNAAIVAHLESGYVILITDADDSLSWIRAEKRGWGATLFTSIENVDEACIASEVTTANDVESLIGLLHLVLQSGVQVRRP